jgi:chaperonin GroES
MTDFENYLADNKLTPMADNIIILTDKPVEITDTGIHIPTMVQDRELRLSGRVLAVGPGRYDRRGHRVEMDVAVGDYVHVQKFSAKNIPGESRRLLICREADVIAIEEGR